MKTYDVIVIGAGSVGTPAAYNLAKAGLKVLVLDQFASPGQGSSKSAIGGVRATHSDPAKIRLCLRSIELLSNWKEETGDDIEWQKNGYCFVAYDSNVENTLRTVLNTQKTYGLNINWWNRQELLDRIPSLNPEGLIGGTISPDDGNASPLLTTYSYYRQCKQLKVDFLFNHSVIGISINGSGVTGVKTDKGDFLSNVIINAGGAYAAPLTKMVGIEIPVTPDSHEAGITEPVSFFLKPMIVDIRPQPGSSNFYFYQHQTGQIMFCITPQPNIWGDNREETSQFLPMVSKRMIEVMPKLVNIRVRRTWRGLYPMTPDGTPIIGWLKEVNGYLLAVGMCGQGFMLGPGLGELITRMVMGSTNVSDQEILQITSPYREFCGQEKLK